MPSSPNVAVIGAGAGGLALAIALKRRLGYDNFTIYENASEVGGTWRDNTYPGCASDVAMPLYSLSTDLHDWTHTHGLQPAIHAYWIGLARKYELYPHIAFNHAVISAEWDSAAQVYRILTRNTITGEVKTVTANILISAVGILEVPKYASIRGVGEFKGEMFHSARWNETVKLSGKRVAVIGNGASATQFVPIISQDPAVQVIQFCRTPNWLMPYPRTEYSPLRRWLTQKIPFLMRFWRWMVFVEMEALYMAVFRIAFLRKLVMKYSTNYIKKNAPAKDVKDLIPTYPMGCKRVLYDANYLAALRRPNLALNWDGIEAVTEVGIITKKGETIPFDVLIFATGFATDQYPIPVRGNKGTTIREYYEAEKGAKAYLGTSIPGFPNFFTILGPNTATGHASVIYTSEIQAKYITQLIKPILTQTVTSLEVKVDATDAYNDKIQARLSRSVFPQCNSWYRVGGEGKITNIFPGAAVTFWAWLRKVNWNHYIVNRQ